MEALVFQGFKNLEKEVHPLEEYEAKQKNNVFHNLIINTDF